MTEAEKEPEEPPFRAWVDSVTARDDSGIDPRVIQERAAYSIKDWLANRVEIVEEYDVLDRARKQGGLRVGTYESTQKALVAKCAQELDLIAEGQATSLTSQTIEKLTCFF